MIIIFYQHSHLNAQSFQLSIKFLVIFIEGKEIHSKTGMVFNI